MISKIEAAKSAIESKINSIPEIALVLGSGLGDFVDLIEDKNIIPYADIPNFCQTSVKGHDGKLVFGKVNGVEVVVMQGRFHVYEGHDLFDVVLPLRALGMLGIKKVVLTNASGGINSNYIPGDLVVINDHINLTGKNPLIGPNLDELGPRFPDMGDTYNKELRTLIKSACEEAKVKYQEGVYCGLLGPTYETPAEIRMLKTLGGDLVGMSTVPEAIAAHHMGLKVCAISCITNYAAGIKDEKLDHDDVKDVALKAMNNFSNLLNILVKKLG
jgi:purine-nucleoside phosphorylase